MTAVAHCKRDPFDIYIGRPSRWGNPFEIGRDGTREEVIAKYEAWILTQPELLAALPELAGRTLGCWCAPLGLWRPGRFAIALRDVERFATPIPFKARQGKFIDVPDELLGLPPTPAQEQGALL